MGEDRGRAEGAAGSGIELAELLQAARTLSPREFEERWGSAFLVLWRSDLAVPDGPGSTVVEIESADQAGQPSGRGDAPVVYPIRRSGRSVGHLVSVGRTANNDVVIADSSVSRFHAFFKERGDGGFGLQDAGSTNGCAVNGDRVPRQGEGPSVALKSGDMVLIGQVGLRFLAAGQLHDLLAGGRIERP